MDIEIRPATPDDLSALCGIERTCFACDAFKPRQLAYLLSRAHGMLLVATQNGEITGYISLLLRKGTHNVRIYSVSTAPQHRGKGIGRCLVKQAIAYATAHGRMAVTLEVRCDNTAAIALYEQLGFTRTERLRNYYHDGDGWRMMFTCGKENILKD